jgi:hypothetical protein
MTGLHLFKGAIAMLARRPNFRQRRIVAFALHVAVRKSSQPALLRRFRPTGEANGPEVAKASAHAPDCSSAPETRTMVRPSNRRALPINFA